MISLTSLLAIICSAILYVALSLRPASQVQNERQYFNWIPSPYLVVIALFSANITFGTNVATYFDQIQRIGFWQLAAPAGILVGYIILCSLKTIIQIEFTSDKPTIYAYLRARDGGRHLELLICAITILSFSALISFEIKVSADYVNMLLFDSASLRASFIIALFLFSVVSFYTISGGLKAAISTDVPQSFFILLLLVAFAVIPSFVLTNSSPPVTVPTLLMNTENSLRAYLEISLIFLGAVTAQLYNIINLHMISSVNPAARRAVLVGAGVFTAIFYSLLCYFAFAILSKGSLSSLMHLVFISDSLIAKATQFAITLGVIAALFSTVDSAIVALLSLWRYNILGQLGREKNITSTQKAISFAGCFVIGASSVAFANFIGGYFILLIFLLFPITIFSPVVISVMYSHARKRDTFVEKPLAVCFSGTVCVLLWGAYSWLQIKGQVEQALILHVVALLLSACTATLVAIRSR